MAKQRGARRRSAQGARQPTPRVVRPRGPRRSPPREIFITSFKAQGSIGISLAGQIYGQFRADPDLPEDMQDPRYLRRKDKYIRLQQNSPVNFPNAPGIWVSNERFILGQVNWPGVVSLQELFDLLNSALNLVHAKTGRLADFRRVYKNWKWKYQVVRVLTVPKNREAEFKRETPERERRQVVTRKRGSSR